MKLSVLFGIPLLFTSLVQAYNNPIIWEDLADCEVRRVNNTYYYSASTFHYSPGAPILRSYDLVNWEYIGHSVPSLDFGDDYSLIGGRAYRRGIWASFFDYHPTKKTWFWGGCIDFWTSYIYSAPSVTGPWTRHTQINKCYYDSGLLIDDDGTMYVSYVANQVIWVAQLSSDAKTEVKSQQMYAPPPEIGYLEGTRMYKRNGKYYIFATNTVTTEYALQASSPFGPYSIKAFSPSVPPPSTASGGYPHQGGLVDTPSGQWFYMAIVGNYPGGRIPVLAPVTWGEDGFPSVSLVNGGWGNFYPDPIPQHPLEPLTGTDYFKSIGPQWEWNHNPDTSKFSVGSAGLVLNTVTVTNDLYNARNTISHRTLGPASSATIKLNYSAMRDGDRAGLSMLRDQSGWVGVQRDNGTYKVAMVTDINMNTDWVTISNGTTAESSTISGGTIWLRAIADVKTSGSKTATFSYSTNGSNFTSIGSALTLNSGWEFFMAYRFAIFNYATSSLGGKVTVASFELKSESLNEPPAGCTVGLYEQCAGATYNGCTTCAAGTTCTYSNPWWSQCQ